MRKGRRTEWIIGVEKTMRKSGMRMGRRTEWIIGVEEKGGMRKGRRTEGIIGVEETMRKSRMRKGGRTEGIKGVEEERNEEGKNNSPPDGRPVVECGGAVSGRQASLCKNNLEF